MKMHAPSGSLDNGREQKNTAKGEELLRSALAPCRQALIGVGVLSCVINVLYLTGSFFMLEVYDRVIPSRSVPTLVGLGIIAAMLYFFQGALDLIRGRILVRIGAFLDQALSGRVFDGMTYLSLNAPRQIDAAQPSRDLDQVKNFITSGGPSAFFDLPWLPVYVLICYLFHPWLGIMALVGAFLLFILTRMTEVGTREPGRQASQYASRRAKIAEASRRNTEVIHALGMGNNLSWRWQTANGELMGATARTADVSLGFGVISKVVRMSVQSATLAVGAYLVIQQISTPGVMIASSILVARALAPVEQLIGQWKSFRAARDGWKRLATMLGTLPVNQAMPLPPPRSQLAVSGIAVTPPGQNTVVAYDITFSLNAGSSLGVIGRSASGKSSLARALVGVWPTVRGNIRLDGASLDQWVPERLGRHIGYVPQDIELFGGTVAENIARFTQDFDPDEVIAAAKVAEAHDLILGLPNGYDTEIGDGGSVLSGGQRQRVALARALFGNPFLIVLDEPNSNLDADGEAALSRVIMRMREQGSIVVVVAHRPSALAACDFVLVMHGGRMQAFGEKNEVLDQVVNRMPQAVSDQTASAAPASTAQLDKPTAS